MGTPDEGDSKPGSEYFRELLRFFPSANVEDYFKNGQWQIKTMQIDTELIEAHRKETGAEDPPPLEEVELPEEVLRLTSGPPRFVPGGMRPRPPIMAPMGGQGWGASGSAPGPRPRLPAAPPVPPELRPLLISPRRPLAPPAGPPGLGAGGPGAALSSPSAAQEVGDIQEFLEKWDVQTAMGKLLLARLTPTRRRWVMENYDGELPLEEFVSSQGSGSPWAPSQGSPHATQSLKRPLSVGPQPSGKRPFGQLPSPPGMPVVRTPRPPSMPPPAMLQRAAVSEAAPAWAEPAWGEPAWGEPAAPSPLEQKLAALGRSTRAAAPQAAGTIPREKPGSLIRSLLQQ